MSRSFSDHFSRIAGAYAEFRPRYPEALFDWLADLAPGRALAWDCATGSGQAAVALSSRFERVIATDASAEQVAAATRNPRVDYRVARAEASGLDGGSTDLVTVAQALHWFDRPAFYEESARVLRRDGVIAAWTYGHVRLEDPRADAVFRRFYSETVGADWPAERALVDSGYRTIDFPFPEVEPPAFEMEARWPLATLLGYVGTWSATTRFRAGRGFDPVPRLAEELASTWGKPEEAAADSLAAFAARGAEIGFDCRRMQMSDPTPGVARIALRERRNFGDGATPIGAIALSPDGRMLATSHAVHPGSPSGSHVRLWQMPDGHEIGRLVPDARAGGPLAFSADGKLLASGSNFGGKDAKIWEVDGLRLVCGLPHPDHVKSIAFSMDGRWLATAAGAPRVWDTPSWTEARSLEGLKDYATSVTFSPDSQLLAASAFNCDRRVVVWNCGSWTVARSFAEHEEGAMRAAFSPDGRWLAAGTNYQELKLWEVATGKEAWARKGHASGIHALAFSPDGRWLASTSNETIKLWSVETGAEFCSQEGHRQTVWGVAFTPDGGSLVSAGWDGRIRMWDVQQS